MSTAQVRVVNTPNRALKQHRKLYKRVYVTFDSTTRPNATNTLFFSGDVHADRVIITIHQALQQLRAKNFKQVS